MAVSRVQGFIVFVVCMGLLFVPSSIAHEGDDHNHEQEETGGSKRTVADSDRLKNNMYGTLVTASVEWIPEMLKAFNKDMKAADATSAVRVADDLIVSTTDKKVAVTRMILTKRDSDRSANAIEISSTVDQALFFNDAWIKKAKAISGKTGETEWIITAVDTAKAVATHGLTDNINGGMTEKFYSGFPEDASNAGSFATNKTLVALGWIVAVGTAMVW